MEHIISSYCKIKVTISTLAGKQVYVSGLLAFSLRYLFIDSFVLQVAFMLPDSRLSFCFHSEKSFPYDMRLFSPLNQ